MQKIIQTLHDGGYSCVITDGKTVRTFTRRGVADLYELLENDAEFLRGASVADKVVGKGAAALMILGGVKRLYADVISEEAMALLRDSGMEVSYGELVPHIINRSHTGRCPLEACCSEAGNAEECLPLIRDFMKRMAAGAVKVLFLALCTATFCTARAEERRTDSLPAERTRYIREVVVTGTRNASDPLLLPMTVTTVGRRTIENALRPSLLPTLTEQVPGLFITGRGVMGYGVSTGAAGGMSLRGIGGTPTAGLLVLIDGNPQYMGLMGHPIADAYQSMLAEKVEVVRGPASVLYGSNAMGGVINIITRRTDSEGLHVDLRGGYGSFNTVESQGAVRLRKGRLTAEVMGSYDRSDGHRRDMDFEQYGGFAKAGLRISSAWSATADVSLTRFNASNPGTVAAPILDNDSRITRGMASIAVRNDYERTCGAVSLFCNWGRHDINDGYAPGGTPLDYRFRSGDRMLGLSAYQTLRLLRGNRLTIGFDWQSYGGRARNRYPDGRGDVITADKTLHDIAGYADMRQSLGRRLTLDAGVRLDHNTHSGTVWIPQGGASLALGRLSQLKALASKGFRFPTIREMFMFPPQNPDLKPEDIMTYELSFSRTSPGGPLQWGVNAYYIDGDNLIVLSTVDGRKRYLNTGRVRNWGAEAETRWSISPTWSLSANYSWLHMQNPVVAAPEHKLFCGIDFAKGRWGITTGAMYVHNLYTQVSPVRTTDSFVLWNADVRFRAARMFEIYVRGENLLAQRYEINAGYPMPRATVLGGVKFRFNH